MLRTIGWILIVVWIFFTILPLYPQTGHFFTGNYFDENKGIIEKTYMTWFLPSLPLEIARDPWSGAGQAIGWIGVLVLGIWLVSRSGKKKAMK